MMMVISLNSEVRINLLHRILPFSQFEVAEVRKMKTLLHEHKNDDHYRGPGLHYKFCMSFTFDTLPPLLRALQNYQNTLVRYLSCRFYV
jgi:hypothetical protein